MTLNVLFTIVVSVMRVVTKRLKLESRCFHYEVPLHLSYLLIKFDEEISRDSF